MHKRYLKKSKEKENFYIKVILHETIRNDDF